MEELRLEVRIDPHLSHDCPNAVAFGQFRSDSTNIVYDHLPQFFEDLILGRPLPLIFAARRVDDVEALVAVSLFLHRELAVEPDALSLVASVELVRRIGAGGLAHIPRDLARFFLLVKAYLPEALVRKEQQERLTTAIGWVRDYLLHGRFPSLPAEPPQPRVIDTGTNGFVLAEMPGGKDLEWGWVELFRQGHLRGVLLGTGAGDRVKVVAAKKSPFMEFDLGKAADILNEAEEAMGEPRAWVSRSGFLFGPEPGTLMLPSTLMDVFLRI